MKETRARHKRSQNPKGNQSCSSNNKEQYALRLLAAECNLFDPHNTFRGIREGRFNSCLKTLKRGKVCCYLDRLTFGASTARCKPAKQKGGPICWLALPYIGIRIQKLPSLRSLSLKNPVSICNTLEGFGQVVVEGFQPFSTS